VTLKNGCAPVYIGDFLIKYKPEKPILEERVDYRNCRLIKSDINGVVVYHKRVVPIEKKTLLGEDLMVSVDIGNAFLKKGDFLLFYKEFKKNLPPLILGTGIVVSAQKTNSTVKLLRLSNPVSIGDKVTYLPIVKMKKNNKGENVPSIGSGQSEIKIKEDDNVLELTVSFKFNEDGISDANKTEINKIKDFIESNKLYRIVLKGFACNIGKLENNLKLSKQRVESVKKYIIDTLKIDQTLIESYFYGEQDCAFDNTAETSRKKNRRVLITVIGK
jgi:outer membrane protein OmpA-like peptidoglycan-associated protein